MLKSLLPGKRLAGAQPRKERGGGTRRVLTAATLSFLLGAGALFAHAPGNLSPLVAHAAGATITEFPIPTGNSGPAGIASGPDGNLWFTENSGNNIGRITPGGTLTEFAVPTASSGPQGIAAGSDGNLWFTESYASSVGRITPSGAITEFATPSANSFPAGIVAGPDGNLWFSEASTANVGRITPNGVITEYPVCQNGLYGLLTKGADFNVWALDVCGGLARIAPDGTVTEFTLPNLNWSAISSGPDGNLWAVGRDNGGQGVVDKVSTAGVVLNTYRTPTAGTSSPQGVAPGPNGAMFMTDSGSQIVESSTDGVMADFALPSTDVNPTGIVAGPDANMWFTESSGNAIGSIVIPPACAALGVTVDHTAIGPGMPVTVSLTLLNCGADVALTNVSTSTTTTAPAGCPAAPAVTELTASAINPGQGNATTTSFSAPSCYGTYTVSSTGTADGPTTIGPSSATYAVAYGASIVYPSPNPSSRPAYMASGPDGNIWFTEGSVYSGILVRVTPTGAMTVVASDSQGGFGAVTAGADGNIWVSTFDNSGDAGIESFTVNGVLVLRLPLPAGDFIERMTLGPDGNVWFTAATPGGGAIGRITPAGALKLFNVLSSQPNGITAGPDGNLWFTLSGQIGRITPKGAVTLFSSGGVNRPWDIATGPDGNLWFTSRFSTVSDIGRITPGGVVSLFPTPVFDEPSVISDGADGNIWYTTGTNRLGRITSAGVITEYVYQAGDVSNAAYGMVSGPDGNLWVAAYNHFAVSEIGIAPPAACAAVTGSSNPAVVAAGQPETTTAVVTNCTSAPRVLTLVAKTTPPSGCGTASSKTVHLVLAPRVGTTEASTFTAPSCTGTYKVKYTLSSGSQIVGSSTLTYQVN